MENAPPNLRILVPLDGSRAGEESLQHAAALAEVFSSELLLLRVVGSSRDERGDQGNSIDWQLRQRQATAYLDQVSRQLGEQGIRSRCFVESGTPAPAVVRFAKEHDIDLVVLSRIGRTGLTDFGDGSVSRKIVSSTDSSVLLMGNSAAEGQLEAGKYKRIVVPVDDSQGAEWAVALAASIAQIHGAELCLVRILETPCHDVQLPETAELKILLERVRSISSLQAARRFSDLRSHVPSDVEITTETRCADSVTDGIARYVSDEHADLVILCAHGSGGHHPWRYGPLAEFLLSHCVNPVLVFQQSNVASAQHYRSHYCQSRSLEAG